MNHYERLVKEKNSEVDLDSESEISVNDSGRNESGRAILPHSLHLRLLRCLPLMFLLDLLQRVADLPAVLKSLLVDAALHAPRSLPPLLFRAANLEPVHSSPSSNHKAVFQPFQYGLFHHFDFVSKCLIATPSLHVQTINQVVPSPPRTATPSGTINNHDVGWRLALRAIYPAATDSD
ncbi:hypothetical protein TNCV_217061 [Trichonephila clavipes]|nr:hypothetical protein TNCV_217061 [Trichonephila clavipes]